MTTSKKWGLILLIASAPIAAFWIYQGLNASYNYEGTCGLLDANWACSKTQYVEYSLFNAFVFPYLAAVSISWVIAVAIVTWLYSRFRSRRKII
jgi:hypothetical protein